MLNCGSNPKIKDYLSDGALTITGENVNFQKEMTHNSESTFIVKLCMGFAESMLIIRIMITS